MWAGLASVNSRSKAVEIDRARARARGQESERRFPLVSYEVVEQHTRPLGNMALAIERLAGGAQVASTVWSDPRSLKLPRSWRLLSHCLD